MNIFKSFILFSAIIVLISCNKIPSNINTNEVVPSRILSVSDTVNYNIPNSIPSPFSRLNFNWNSNAHYVGFLGDEINNEIQVQVLDLKNHEWQSITLSTEGQNQVYGIGSFSFNEDKTINYFPSITPRILNVNFQGEVLSNKEFSGVYAHAINVSVFNPDVMLTDNKVGFLSTEFLNMDDVENYELARLYTIYNLETDTAKHIIKYPKEFRDNAWSPNDRGLATIYNKGNIIFSFSKSHYLYVYDTNGELQEQANVKVKGIGDAKPLKKGDNDAISNMLRTEITGKYSSLIYDKWRNVYYRIGNYYDAPSIEPKSFKELSGMRHKLTYVIATLNEDFQVIGADYFNYFDTNINNGSYFVNKDGLYMNLNNTEDENTLSYVRLVLKQ